MLLGPPFHWSGRFWPSATPEAYLPRKDGQFVSVVFDFSSPAYTLKEKSGEISMRNNPEE